MEAKEPKKGIKDRQHVYSVENLSLIDWTVRIHWGFGGSQGVRCL